MLNVIIMRHVFVIVSRPHKVTYKLTGTRFFTSAAARREKYGGGGVDKFRLARRLAEFFFRLAAAAEFGG